MESVLRKPVVIAAIVAIIAVSQSSQLLPWSS